MQSQITSKEPRVKVISNRVNDTLIQTNLPDSKIILRDLLQKEVCDSLVTQLEKANNLNSSTINLQMDKIQTLEQKYDKEHQISTNLETVLGNKNKEIDLLNDTIKQQDRKIFKLKVYKFIGIPAVIALPIVTTLYLLK